MITEKEVVVQINGNNRKKYEEILLKDLKNGESIEIKQSQVLPTSRLKVECFCDLCQKVFTRRRVDIKTEVTLCSRECRNNYLKLNNPNPKVEKITVKCHICRKSFQVYPSKYKSQDYFMCSRTCYKKHRSDNLHSSSIYNYQNTFVECAMCKKEVKTSQWYTENRKHLFCSQECYWRHRREFYTEFYYKSDLNEARPETNPERLVREWLEEKEISFKQECPFLRKYYVDFFLTEYKVIVEVYGDYWHCNPSVYDTDKNDKTKKPVNEYQQKLIESDYDNIRQKELESYGFSVVILWESDIMTSVNEAIKNSGLLDIIHNKQKSLTTERIAPVTQGEDTVWTAL